MMSTGSEQMVLAECDELADHGQGFVLDSDIARKTGIALGTVQNCLLGLGRDGYVDLVRLEDGHFKASVTPRGRQELPTVNPPSPPPPPPPKVVPKGLRSFDDHDADFFLDLLPGPRRADGLPESIHFWKVRIEEVDPDKTFSVGVIYGPSGCGKSSLVKAGLLPRLADSVIRIYFEATANDTEARLLRELRKHAPKLPTDLALPESVRALQEGQFDQRSKKVLVVIDQFEQWLHAKRLEEATELVQALGHCDGRRIQAIVLVRVDFWMALTRFMGKLGIELHQGQNFAAVDLFDMRHAKKILTAFGRVEGALPENLADFTEQQRKFLDQAVSELAQNGKVVSVRLTLFFEMVKSRPWTPTTLREVGGIEGLGVAFLEEKFYSPQADPRYRGHQKAAQSVLKSLLPESGTIIYGNAKSQQALLEISGYVSRLKRFDELLWILDGELRLITPTEPAGSTVEDQRDQQSRERYYQLTHDYLVPLIREWLTRKQKETWRGWFEIRLAERSALWIVKPVNRYLSPVWEWSGIRLLTKKRDWTEPQQKMMRRAGRVHGLRTLALASLIALITWGGYEAYGSFQARALVDSLKTASTAEVPAIVKNLSGYYRWARRPLSDLLSSTEEQSSPHHLHASLALLPVDPGQVEYLYNRMLNVNPTELQVIREALSGHQWTLIERLWGVLENTQADRDQRFRAAWALAGYVADETEQRWVAASRFITDRLLASVIENPSSYTPLKEMLRPIRKQLLASLATTFRDPQRKTERYFATNILADYASDQPNLLADLLMDSDFKAYAAFFPIAQEQAAKTLPLFQAEIRKQATIPDSDKDSELVKDQLAERQARAAVALLRMGKAGEIIPLLRHSADPRLRSFIVNWLHLLGADPKILADELDRIDPSIKPTPAEPPKAMDAILFHTETSMRRALILALGTYGTEGLSPDERQPLINKLLALYRNDPDSGIHGAAQWTLRQWKQQESLKAVDTELGRLKDRGDRRWYVNGQGQTYAVIEGPVEFRMGSPPTDPERLPGEEILYRRIIPRRFAIATQEVTVEQYQEFVKENPVDDHANSNRYSPDLKGPMNEMSWYHAAVYCNWLSRKENLPKCYEPNDKGEYAEGMKIVPDALEQPGYRLPTEAEWEYACRAGAVTSRYYGRSVELLGKYAWYLQNSQDRAWPCGQLLPNELGLFDMLGNVDEWCHEQYYRYPEGEGNTTTDDMNILSSIKQYNPRILRGGSFDDLPAFVRSAVRSWDQPSYRSIVYGFRLARTFP